MRTLACALLAGGLLATPVWAFSNEYHSGPLHQEHGHGELVRRAALGTGFEARAAELVQGQRDLDFPGAASGSVELGAGEWWRALVSAFAPDEQKKHALRWYSGLPAWRAATRPLAADWAEVVSYVVSELRAAYHAPVAGETLFLGHVLHTLQDSYSPAHVTRTPDGHIRDVAYYPGEHRFVDDRDAILTASGDLTPEASAAVAASHELLEGFGRVRNGDEATFERWVEGFMARHLALAGR
ncbi:MAG TPA: hypothetical protein V6D05_02520 [Stenomitos sp.]